jgi:CubicO group peptidase (beta-lactamase class C family)
MRLPLTVAVLAAVTVAASAQFNESDRQRVETAAQQVLAETGVPSASVGIVMNGKIVYTGAFGLANISPPRPAEASMAYPIGSISKQFTATAVLLLQQQGKLSIDDPVSKYFPELTRAKDVTLRNLLTMTSGYEDFAPQDYVIPEFYRPEDPLKTVHDWAGKPLDFEPGTEWQYSNTNYVLVALIVQKVTGEPFYQFLRESVLAPLHLEGVFNAYTQREKLQVTGYVSNAMAPPRVQPLEANSWYFGDGELAMPASTLLAWDIGIINQSLLSAASYKLMETPFVLRDGTDSTYGLGLHVSGRNGHRMLEHSGEVGGYVAENIVFPDDKYAVVVLTNEVASSAAGKIATAVSRILFPAAFPAAGDTFAPQLKTILGGLQHSQIDRSLFTSNCNAYFSAETLEDFQTTLAPLGTISAVTRTSKQLRGGMTFFAYNVSFSGGTTVRVTVFLKSDGKIEQLLVVGKA